MTLLTNPFKRGIAEGQLQIGFWQALANAYTAELCATAGFDWLLFDCEHAPNDVPLLLTQLQAVAPYRTHPVARIPNQDPSLIKRYLDVGVQTLLVPYVESAAQAEALVRATRYPPAGIRGVGFHWAGRSQRRHGLSRSAWASRRFGGRDQADRDSARGRQGGRHTHP